MSSAVTAPAPALAAVITREKTAPGTEVEYLRVLCSSGVVECPSQQERILLWTVYTGKAPHTWRIRPVQNWRSGHGYITPEFHVRESATPQQPMPEPTVLRRAFPDDIDHEGPPAGSSVMGASTRHFAPRNLVSEAALATKQDHANQSHRVNVGAGSLFLSPSDLNASTQTRRRPVVARQLQGNRRGVVCAGER